MSVRILIEDTSLDLSVTVHASGGYSPDVIHDLQARAVETYRATLSERFAVLNGLAAVTEGSSDE